MMMHQGVVHEKPEACAWMAGGEGVTEEGDNKQTPNIEGGSDLVIDGSNRDHLAGSMVGFEIKRKKRMPRQRRSSSTINHLLSFAANASCSATTHLHVPAFSLPLQDPSSLPARVRILFIYSFNYYVTISLIVLDFFTSYFCLFGQLDVVLLKVI